MRAAVGPPAGIGGDVSQASFRRALAAPRPGMPQGLGAICTGLCPYDNIDFSWLFGVPAAERDARIQRLMKATASCLFCDRPAGKLSGGMKKVSLCAALVHDPDLLILDEPTTGVDPGRVGSSFWALVDCIQALTSP